MGENGFLKAILTIVTIISTIVGTYMTCTKVNPQPPQVNEPTNVITTSNPQPPQVNKSTNVTTISNLPPSGATSINIFYNFSNRIELVKLEIAGNKYVGDGTGTINIPNVPKGVQTYSIEGRVIAPDMYGNPTIFYAKGNETIDIKDNSNFAMSLIPVPNEYRFKIILTQ